VGNNQRIKRVDVRSWAGKNLELERSTDNMDRTRSRNRQGQWGRAKYGEVTQQFKDGPTARRGSTKERKRYGPHSPTGKGCKGGYLESIKRRNGETGGGGRYARDVKEKMGTAKSQPFIWVHLKPAKGEGKVFGTWVPLEEKRKKKRSTGSGAPMGELRSDSE